MNDSHGFEVAATDLTRALELLRRELASLGAPVGTQLYYSSDGFALLDELGVKGWRTAQPRSVARFQPPTKRWPTVLIALLVFFALVGAVVWNFLGSHDFTVRFVSVEFIPANSGAAFPGSQRYPGEDALAVRFESDMNLMNLAQIGVLTFACYVDGSTLDDPWLSGRIFPDLSDARWVTDIATHWDKPKQYIGRVRLWGEAGSTYRDILLDGKYEGLRCRVAGIQMVGTNYYSTEMIIPSAMVGRAVATALGK